MAQYGDSSDPYDVQSVQEESFTPQGIPNTQNSTQVDINQPNHENLSAETNENGADSGSKRKLTSDVWHHFQRKSINGKDKAICMGCKGIFVGGGRNGTTHLREHLRRCLKVKNQADIKQTLLKATISRGSFTITMGKYKFKPEVVRSELANMIVLHGYPLAMVDHIGFRRYSKSLNPDFKMISRNTLRSEIFDTYKEEKEKLKKLLSTIEGRVAVTTDMWTCKNQKKGYMAVTTHFIDDDWILQSRLIRFAYVPCPHTKETIVKVLFECLVDFNLDERISTVTVDNCTTNDGVVMGLLEKLDPAMLILDGRFLHMRCCAHILNLIVKDGLDVIGDAIEKVRDAVAFWIATPKRVEKFEEACRYFKIGGGKKLVLDCKTRWNSTYEMLEIALMYKEVFSRLNKNSKGKNEKFPLPTPYEWQMAKDICDRLALFSRATEAFSGRHYPTANLYFQKVCEIRLALRKWLACGNSVIKAMAENMILKFDKYWDVINGILAVASILDPMKKLECVSFYFHLIYGDGYEIECLRIKQFLTDLVDDYKDKMNFTSEPSSSRVLESDFILEKRTFDEMDDCENLWEKHVLQAPPKRSSKSEVDVYLEEERLVMDEQKFNILAWWSANSGKYPILSRVAKDILAVPISTVPSESAFSVGGKVVSPQRSRLHPSTVEALMCLQSWLFMQFKDATKENPLALNTILEDEDVDVQPQGESQDCRLQI